MLHTIPSFNSTCSGWVKKRQQVLCKVGRSSERKGFIQPGFFRRYNEGMGAVDSQDQRLEAYRSSVKTRSLQTKMLCHFINQAVVNIFLWQKSLYRNCKCGNCLPDYHLTFWEGLAEALTELWVQEHSNVEEEDRPQRLAKKDWEMTYSVQIARSSHPDREKASCRPKNGW